MEYIKVNLPASQEAYRNGNGEGVWVLVEENVKKAYDTDEGGTCYKGILDNDSVYYPALKHGVTIPFEMRGENRPVVPYTWLTSNYPVLNGVYYLFDCLDGSIGDELLTLEELSQRMNGGRQAYTEQDAKHIASDYEAELHRYTYKDGVEIEHKQLTKLIF